MADEYVITKKGDLVSIADAIRNKTGKSDKLSISQLSVNVEQISQNGTENNAGIDTSDATATAGDIANGKTAYVDGIKITGTHTCSSGSADTSDATALAEDIISGKTAYINGGKVTGTLVVNSYYVGDTEPSDSLGDDGDLYFVRGE